MNTVHTARRRSLAVLVVGAVALIASVVSVAASASTAEAASTRFGARRGQVDVLFTRSETISIASGVVGGIRACSWLSGGFANIGSAIGGIVGGLLAAFAVGSMCVSAVTVCAAKANLKGRSAGMTVAPAWYGLQWWCWDY